MPPPERTPEASWRSGTSTGGAATAGSASGGARSSVDGGEASGSRPGQMGARRAVPAQQRGGMTPYGGTGPIMYAQPHQQQLQRQQKCHRSPGTSNAAGGSRWVERGSRPPNEPPPAPRGGPGALRAAEDPTAAVGHPRRALPPLRVMEEPTEFDEYGGQWTEAMGGQWAMMGGRQWAPSWGGQWAPSWDRGDSSNATWNFAAAPGPHQQPIIGGGSSAGTGDADEEANTCSLLPNQ